MRAIHSGDPRDHYLELMVSTVWIFWAVSFLIDPTVLTSSPVGRQIGAFAYVWTALYLIGGPMTIYGCLSTRTTFRFVGLWILGVGLLAHGCSAVFLGPHLLPRDFTYWVQALACLLRASWLSLVAQHVWPKDPDEA